MVDNVVEGYIEMEKCKLKVKKTPQSNTFLLIKFAVIYTFSISSDVLPYFINALYYIMTAEPCASNVFNNTSTS